MSSAEEAKKTAPADSGAAADPGNAVNTEKAADPENAVNTEKAADPENAVNAEKAADPENAESRENLEKKARKEAREAARKEAARKRAAVQGVMLFLIAAAAIAMFAISFHLPVLQIYGTAMEPALDPGDMVLCAETRKYERGDLVAFKVDNKLIVRRVVGLGGEEIDIDENGVVSVNGTPIDEPYAQAKDQGKSNIKYPYTVPPGHLFVLSDKRDNVVDSRNTAVGCIDPSVAEGRLIFRMWPAPRIGLL